MAPGRLQTGPARPIIQNEPKINAGDNFECHFLTFFCSTPKDLYIKPDHEILVARDPHGAQRSSVFFRFAAKLHRRRPGIAPVRLSTRFGRFVNLVNKVPGTTLRLREPVTCGAPLWGRPGGPRSQGMGTARGNEHVGFDNQKQSSVR